MRTPQIERILTRSTAYLRAGLAVHFRGRAGTGKTTMALMAARSLGRPVALLYGNDDYRAGDLLGERIGYRRRLLFDNYIHNVQKTEDELFLRWMDSRLAEACKEGWVLVYDEFNRSRPETNNALLSILEERLLDYPSSIYREPLPVHEDFRAILTSNPDEYAGVHRAQDALLDRLVTIDLDCFDEETETAIAASHAGIEPESIRPLVRAVRRLRGDFHQRGWPSLRTSIMLAKVVAAEGIAVSWREPFLRDLLADVILGHLPGPEAKELRPSLERILAEELS